MTDTPEGPFEQQPTGRPPPGDHGQFGVGDATEEYKRLKDSPKDSPKPGPDAGEVNKAAP